MVCFCSLGVFTLLKFLYPACLCSIISRSPLLLTTCTWHLGPSTCANYNIAFMFSISFQIGLQYITYQTWYLSHTRTLWPSHQNVSDLKGNYRKSKTHSFGREYNGKLQMSLIPTYRNSTLLRSEYSMTKEYSSTGFKNVP